jgi:hypothetical protein
MSGSSLTAPEELARGIGLCAVSRVYLYAQIARDIATFKHEKISGRFTRAIGYGNGITTKSFDAAIQQNDEKNDAMGYTRYAGIPFVLSMKDQMNLGLLDLASLPDGFDFQTDMTLWIYLLAFAFGVDAREFWPATASGATKADATIQHLKAMGKGFAEDVKAIEHAINWKVFPEGVALEFDAKDDEEDQRVAALHQTRIVNVDYMVKNLTITPQEGKAILISQGVIDPNVLATASQPLEADDSKPLDLEAEPLGDQPPLPEPSTLPAQPVTPPIIAGKEELPKPEPIKGKPLPHEKAVEVQIFNADEVKKFQQEYEQKFGKGKNA